MPTPFLNETILELSRWVQDERLGIGENDAEHDFSEATLVSALNRAARVMLNSMIEKETDRNKLTDLLNDYVKESVVTITGGIGDMPDTALKGLDLSTDEVEAIFTNPLDWYSTELGYNPEEIGDNKSPRWTEFGRKVRLQNFSPTSVRYMYIEKHIYVNIGDTDDLRLDRFQNELLEIAEKLINKVAPIN